MPSEDYIILAPLIGIGACVLVVLAVSLVFTCFLTSSEDDETLTSDGARPRSEILVDPGAPVSSIFIVSRSEDLQVQTARSVAAPSRQNNPERVSSGPAPDYEPPPTYEVCIKNGIV